jgi:hypothetical protein
MFPYDLDPSPISFDNAAMIIYLVLYLMCPEFL